MAFVFQLIRSAAVNGGRACLMAALVCSLLAGNVQAASLWKSAGGYAVEKAIGHQLPDGLAWKVGLAVVLGAAVVCTGGLAASPFVAAGTTWVGSAVGGAMGYSGAAATSAGLAAIGGGSIASGGLGVSGGAAIVSAGIGAATTVAGHMVPDEIKDKVSEVTGKVTPDFLK